MKDTTNPKEFFDRAYSHLWAGEIKEAAANFQHIINNQHIFGHHPALIAEQRIHWYCVPIDRILAEMDQSNYPVDVHSILLELFKVDPRYKSTEVDLLIETIEYELAKIPICIRVGKTSWVYRAVLEELAKRITVDLANSLRMLSLQAIICNEWTEYCQEHSFPNNYSEAALAEVLKNYKVKILGGKVVVSEKLLPYALNVFANSINNSKKPQCLTDFVLGLSPEISASPNDLAIIEKYLALNLDKRFVQYIPGYYLTRSLLQFNNTSFDDLFSLSNLPLNSIKMLEYMFSGLGHTHITSDISDLVKSQLKNNPFIIRINEDSWFSSSRFNLMHDQISKLVKGGDSLISLEDFIKQLSPDIQEGDVYRLQELILYSLQKNDQVVQVTQNQWMHIEKISRLIDKAYQYILDNNQATIEIIVKAVLNHEDLPTPLSNFYSIITNYLRNDSRFSLVPNSHKVWRAIPQGQRDNEAVFKLLKKINKIVSEDEIVAELQLSDPEFDLDSDPRFQLFPNNRWGLSVWICINDHAYKYLLQNKKALHENVIIGLVCKEYKFPQRNAFFTPDNDMRFAKDSINRWFCRYLLEPSDLNKLLEELDKYAGVGRRLDLLSQTVLRMNPDATNIFEILSSDHRFIHIDDLWYSRRIAFRDLSSNDLKKIYNWFSNLPNDSPAISLNDVGFNALGWDGRLTNAANILSKDNRYIERHLGFWVLSTWSSPNYERTFVSAATGINPSSELNTEDLSIKLPLELTERGKDKKPKILTGIAQKRHYRTLSQLDILHGNIRITGLLKKWIPKNTETILLVDNQSNQSVAYVDDTCSILNIRDWIQKRELTYGDKIFVEPGTYKGCLFIRPYGKRDQRVYQEAMQHQDIERLIEEARRINMTYHDLMIEMMEAFSFPLHREDVFQLVDYQRTATRNTIFEILSLTDCPYEELRYFVPTGKGYWFFDRKIKKAYEMKMKELIEENEALKGHLALQTKFNENEKEITAPNIHLQDKILSLEQFIQTQTKEKTELSDRIQVLTSEKLKLDDCNLQLGEQLRQLQEHLMELTNLHNNSIAQLKSLQSKQTELNEKDTRIAALEAELEQSENAKSEAVHQISTLKELVNKIQTDIENLRKDLSLAKASCVDTEKQVGDLVRSRELLQSELASLQIQSKEEIYNFNTKIYTIETQKAELENQLQIATDQLSKEKEEMKTFLNELHIIRQELVDVQNSSSKKIIDLEQRIQKLNSKLDEDAISFTSLETRLMTVSREKTTIEAEYLSQKERLTQQLSLLQNKFDILHQTNISQTQELDTLDARITQIDRALATPLGKLFKRLQRL